MDKQLRRILNLVRKTGDRMVVTDGNGEDVYVVMGLEQYENLVIPHGITGVQPVGKDELEDGWYEDCGPEEEPGRVGPIVPSVSTVSHAPNEPYAPISKSADIWDAMAPAGSDSETWDISRMTETEKVDLEKQFENYQQEKGRIEDGNSKLEGNLKVEDEKAKIDQKDEDFGEEQFYLEPIE